MKLNEKVETRSTFYSCKLSVWYTMVFERKWACCCITFLMKIQFIEEKSGHK